MDRTQSPLTRHAAARARQRGIPKRLLHILLAHADRELHAGAGCSTLRLSRHIAGSLVVEVQGRPDADRELGQALVDAGLVARPLGGALNGGVLSLTQGLAADLAEKKIRVNTACTGRLVRISARTHKHLADATAFIERRGMPTGRALESPDWKLGRAV